MNTRPTPTTRRRSSALLAGLFAASLPTGHAHETTQALADLSLEQLMNETVTSVSKKEQKLNLAPAAISVLSNDDLRRSGATSVAEALRLVPGMSVASVNSGQTAISSRGFNNLYANKLLVLVDGRAVYSPLFAGVYWDLQQTTLEDVDRIEVIRGPGATVWGANAVNGVINIVTRDAKETQGTLLYAGGGDVQQTMAGVRHGGRIGERTYYRVYASEQSRDDYLLAGGAPARDNWASQQGGFRLDHHPREDTRLTWQTEMTSADLNDRRDDAYNFHTLGRWTRDWSDRSGVEFQTYYDRTHRNEQTGAYTTIDTVDFSLQHRFGLGERNDVIWGLGFRHTDGQAKQTNPFLLVRDRAFDQHIVNAFVQDEIKLVPNRLTLTVGTKIEHNDYTGVEIQPSTTLVFTPTQRQTLWTSVSRAVRTPGILEATPNFAPLFGAPFLGPGGILYVPTLVGNPDVASETLWAYELGWRIQPTDRVNVDVSLFYNVYDNVITVGGTPVFVPGAPTGVAELPWSNDLRGHTYGGEASVTVSPADNWRVIAAYSLLIANIRGPAPFAATSENSAPRHQVSLRSAHDFTKRWSLDGQARFVDAIEGVPSYVTADLRLSFRPNNHLELALVGQNLLDPSHPEQAVTPFSASSEVPRGFYGKVTWQF